jgi:hypothetical protein
VSRSVASSSITNTVFITYNYYCSHRELALATRMTPSANVFTNYLHFPNHRSKVNVYTGLKRGLHWAGGI